MEIQDLPNEMLMRVFRLLHPRDLKMVVLVSRDWRMLGEDPSLWKCLRFMVHNREDINHLSMRRLRDIQEICINPGDNWEDWDSQAIFQAASKLYRLKKINGLDSVNLSSVKPGLFAKGLTKLEDVTLGDTGITNHQKQALFREMCLNNKLKSLDFYSNNLSSVEPGLFARAINRLESVNLCETDITDDQKQALFTAMSQNSQLKKLDLSGNSLSYVKSKLLAMGMARLEVVQLSDTDITNEQAQAIFSVMCQNSHLKSLHLDCNNLSSVKPGLFVKLVTRMEDVNLCDTDITDDQKTALFAGMSQNCQLKILDLSCNNLSSVEPGLFAKGMSRLVDVNLCASNLTNQQKQAFFAAMSKNCHLKRLDLSANNLSSVEPELFARVMTRLEDVNLCCTDISNDQKQAFFVAMSENSKLKKLDLSCNNLSSVEPGLFARAMTRLEDVNLSYTDITDEQAQALFTALCRNSPLKALDLHKNNLSSVEPRLFARGMSRLVNVTLCDTDITNQQKKALFSAISQSKIMVTWAEELMENDFL